MPCHHIHDILIYLEGMAANIPLFLAIVIPVSTVTYYVIERPIERLAKRKISAYYTPG